jgi:hypothetical protein
LLPGAGAVIMNFGSGSFLFFYQRLEQILFKKKSWLLKNEKYIIIFFYIFVLIKDQRYKKSQLFLVLQTASKSFRHSSLPKVM